MNLVDSLLDLFRHMEWADATMWNVVLGSEVAASDSTVRKRMHHTHMVQRAFLNIWRGAPHTSNAGSDLTIREILPWGRGYYAVAKGYFDNLDPALLDSPVYLPWAESFARRAGREPAIPTLGETILQVFAHSTYHRAQVSARIRELGMESPLTDFIVWIWASKPAPLWPSLRRDESGQ